MNDDDRIECIVTASTNTADTSSLNSIYYDIVDELVSLDYLQPGSNRTNSKLIVHCMLVYHCTFKIITLLEVVHVNCILCLFR